MADQPKLRHVSRDKKRLVEEDDPDAGFIVNPNDPGEFAGLLEGKGKAAGTRTEEVEGGGVVARRVTQEKAKE